jgi:hypothetical protein
MSAPAENEYEALQALVEARARGEVDGVWFDFRHAGLPANGWQPTTLWDFFEQLADVQFIPWEPNEKLSRPVAGIGASWKSDRVRPGDEVFIRSVERFRRGHGPLTDPHDNQELWAYLAIRRPDGAEEPIEGPVMFVPPDAMAAFSHHESFGRDEDYAEYLREHAVTFNKIGARTERLSEATNTASGREWLKLAQDMHSQAEDLLAARLVDWGDDARLLTDLAATAGYALAHAEAEERLVPKAELGLKASRDRLRATEAARKANTKDETRRIIAEAEAMCAANPQLSLNGCAQALAALFPNREARNISRSIHHLFEKRNLPSGRLEFRPKRGGHTAV